MNERRRIAVAYSGGRDSTALLHATLAAAQAQQVEVVALHVHHGLSVNADAWLAHCAAQCERWRRAGRALVFDARRLSGVPARGESVEAWARAERYAALAAMARAHGVQCVLLAHHERDQAETFLLQALRGAGAAGLAAMPRRAERDGIVWQRPWLAKPRTGIDAYLRRHRLKYIEDESNADTRFARSRLRARIWPVLSESFEQVDAAFARSAAWAQQAREVLDEVGAEDLLRCVVNGALRIACWRGLSPARRRNALRLWLRGQGEGPAPASLIERLAEELIATRQARWPFGPCELRLYRGELRCEPPRVADESLPREAVLSVRGVGSYPLPGWGGRLEVEVADGSGVPLAWLAHLELCARRGGERFQAGLDRPARSLKKQFQDAGVPSWQREGPLVYSGGQLVFVPGLGLDARVLGLPGQPLVALRWLAPAGDAAPGRARHGR